MIHSAIKVSESQQTRATIIAFLSQASKLATIGNQNQAVNTLEQAALALPHEPVFPLRALDRLRQVNLIELANIRALDNPYKIKAERCALSNNKFRTAAVQPALRLATIAGADHVFRLGENERKTFACLLGDVGMRGWADVYVPLKTAVDIYYPQSGAMGKQYG